MTVLRHCLRAAALGAALAAAPLAAQETGTAFGDGGADPDAPVEIDADRLSVDQESGVAVFSGSVRIVQDTMRLGAARVRVIYTPGGDRIERLEATGGVTLVSGEDAAEATRADYNITTGMIELRGDVLLVQGESAITGDTMLVDTEAGTARVTGRVKTVLQPGGDDR